MHAIQTRTMTLALRWDGPRLTRAQLAAKANAAIQRAQRRLEHLQLEMHALPSEEQQYAQVIVRTACSDEDAAQLKHVLREAFGQTMASRATTAHVPFTSPASFGPRHEEGFQPAQDMPQPMPSSIRTSGSWIGMLCFMLGLLVATAILAVAFAGPFLPFDLSALLNQ